jgi:hypothetical protein
VGGGGGYWSALMLRTVAISLRRAKMKASEMVSPSRMTLYSIAKKNVTMTELLGGGGDPSSTARRQRGANGVFKPATHSSTVSAEG